MSPASRSDARNCLNSLTPSSPPPLRRLSIRPVAQTDGSFGQASLQGPETSGNVLNRSLRCFLPCAAIDPKAGAHRLVNSPDTKTCLCRPPCAYVCEFSISWCTRCRARSCFFEHGLIGGNKKNCHIPPTHFFCVGVFSHLNDFCPRTPAFPIGVFHEFNCFPPNLAFSIGKKQDNCLFPPTEISAIVGGKPGNEKTCLHFFEAWA